MLSGNRVLSILVDGLVSRRPNRRNILLPSISPTPWLMILGINTDFAFIACVGKQPQCHVIRSSIYSSSATCVLQATKVRIDNHRVEQLQDNLSSSYLTHSINSTSFY